jgi:hypothetical protein
MLQIYLHREEGTTKAIYSSLRSAAAEKQSVNFLVLIIQIASTLNYS